MDISNDEDTLAGQLLAPGMFEPFAEDCRALLAAEIGRKGLTVRTAYSVVRRLKPDILERVVREVMPDFLAALEPCHAEFQAADTDDFEAFLIARDERVAEAALQAADRRAARIQNRSIRSAFNRVRGKAKSEIRPAVPALARIIRIHLERG